VAALDRLRVDPDDLSHVKPVSADIVFGEPSCAGVDRLVAVMSDKKKTELAKFQSNKTICKDLVLYPEGKDLDTLFARKPGLPTRIVTAAFEVASDEAGTEAKKLKRATSKPARS
jgi:hypothetical protein